MPGLRVRNTSTPGTPRKADKVSRRSDNDSSKPISNPSVVKQPQAESAKRLLRPHALSSRLRKLCDQGQADAAIAMLKTSAIAAQNTPVWNTMIWECLKAKRYGVAYRMFTDMKRRGFKPTTRTFQTLFAGISRIEDWHTHSKQLANAHAVYDNFQRHLESLKTHDPHSPDISITPIASYIKILADAGDYQRIFDVYYAMDQKGALAPNQFIFAAMFRALAERRGQTPDGRPTIDTQNASDAKLLWRQMLKASEKPPGFLVDSHIVSPAIIALSCGPKADQDFALDIVREYLGLTQSTDAMTEGKLVLTPQALEAALSLCNHMRDYRLCLYFFKQVRHRPDKFGGPSIIDRGHVEEVLKAHAAITSLGSLEESYHALQTLEWMLKQEMTGSNGARIRPAVSTYNLVLLACWRGGDWSSAVRTFEIMTGHSAKDFDDSRDLSRGLTLQQRSRGRHLIPDTETMSYLVRTALAARNAAYIRQSLRMVHHFGVDNPAGSQSINDPQKGVSRKRAKIVTFQQVKLARAIAEAVEYIESSGQVKADGDLWRVLKVRAGEILRENNSTVRRPVVIKGSQS